MSVLRRATAGGAGSRENWPSSERNSIGSYFVVPWAANLEICTLGNWDFLFVTFHHALYIRFRESG